VRVPHEQLEATTHTGDDHTVRTIDGETYLAARFSIADSTLTIEKLSPADKNAGAQAPLSFPLSEVESVHRIENRPPLYVMIGAVGLFVLVVAIVAGGDAFTD
jgi:hypothetical protein